MSVDLKGSTNTVYEALNHLVCTHNLPIDDKKCPRPAYMIWPKRMVSFIDYIDEANDGDCNVVADAPNKPINPDKDNRVIACVLNTKNTLTVHIDQVSSSAAEILRTPVASRFRRIFQNNIVEDLPFGIDICLDYAAASVQKDEYRIAQLDKREFKLNFQISAGMGLELGQYKQTPYIQYAIYYDGHYGSVTNVWKLHYSKQNTAISYDDLSPIHGDLPDTDIKGAIIINETDAFAAPKDANTTDIPNILDEMNPGIVRIWSLECTSQPIPSS